MHLTDARQTRLIRRHKAIELANQTVAAKDADADQALFLKAQAFIEQKKFAEATAIYQAESARILSSDRKQALVGEILRCAEKLEAKPSLNVPDAPPAVSPLLMFYYASSRTATSI